MSNRRRRLRTLNEMYGNPSIEELREELRKRREYRDNIRAIRSSPQRLFDALNSRSKKDAEGLPRPSNKTRSLLDTISKRSEPSRGFSEAEKAAIMLERGKEAAEKAERNWNMRNRPSSQAGSKGWDEFLPNQPKLQAKARERAIERAERKKEKHAGNEAMAGLFRKHALDEEGNIDPEKLAAAPYPVRAWYEKHRVVSGETKERRGGVQGSDWYESLKPSAKKRYDRLVKISHFGTKGRGLVVPHPTSEGHFILVDEDGDRIENPDLHGRMEKLRQIEGNQRRIDENPEYYEKAFQRRRDRERTMDARREMRRGNRHKAIAINMNLPMDHPAVIDAVKGVLHNTKPYGREGMSDAPSDSASYWAAYYGLGEGEGGGGGGRGSGSPPAYKPPESFRREWKPTNPEEMLAFEQVGMARDKMLAIDQAIAEASGPEGNPRLVTALQGQRLMAKEDFDKASERFREVGMSGTPMIPQQGGVPGVTPWVQPQQREDIRGKDFSGEWDHRYGGGDPTSAWAQLSPAQGGAGSKLHELYKGWSDWMSPEERAALAEAEAEARRQRQAERERQAQQANQAQQQAPGVQSPGLGPGAGQGLSPPQRPMEGPPEPPAPGQQLPSPPTGAYSGDMTNASPEQLAQQRRATEQGAVPVQTTAGKESWVQSKRAEYRPVSQGKNPQELMANPSMIEPYQPRMGESGQWEWEPVDRDQWWQDYNFDNQFGTQLWDIKNRLDSEALANSNQRQDQAWYDTFMMQARQVVVPGYLPQGQTLEENPQVLDEVDSQIHRWGDRHMTSSSYWNSNSPSVTRGRSFEEPPPSAWGTMGDSIQAGMGWGGKEDDWSSVRNPKRGPPWSMERFGNMLEYGWDVFRRPIEGAFETTFGSNSPQHQRRKRNFESGMESFNR